MPVARPESSGGARVIAHVDMDCFYVQVEQRKQPHLRGQPAAVVQYNSWKGGGLIAVSYEARKCGVKRSMRGDDAKQVCPQIQLVQVPVARGKADLGIYRNAGSEVVSILSRKGRCERASIDEVYLDLTDAVEAMLADATPNSWENFHEEALKSHILGLNEDGSNMDVREWFQCSYTDHHDKLLACGAHIVAELRMQVLKETEFTCSAGIAHNKMLAKLASGMNKPAQQTVVPFTSVKGLLESLPIKKMKQLGGKLGSSLQIDLGVNTVGDLLQFSVEKLQERYGINTGTWLWNIARGISGEEVEGRLLPKSHGSGKTFPGRQALKSMTSVEHWISELCEELSERLQSDLDQNKRIARTLTLHANAFKSSDSESQKKFPSKSCPLRYGSEKIKDDALSLFQAGLREFLGSHGTKAQASRCSGWGITGLSVSASKIVAVPTGTHSIMKYFGGQDQYSCPSKKDNDRIVLEEAPSSPSGSESNTGLHPVEPCTLFHEETEAGHSIPSLNQQKKTELSKREGIHSIMKYFGGQVQHSCPSKKDNDGIDSEDAPPSPSGSESNTRLHPVEPSPLLHEETEAACSTPSLNQQEKTELFKREETNNFQEPPCGLTMQSQDVFIETPVMSSSGAESCLEPRQRPQEQKKKVAKDKGTTSILRFFKSCSNLSSSQKQDHVGTMFEAEAGSTSSIPTQTGSENGMPMGREDQNTEEWRYKYDDIDPNVVNELPPEIQEELRAWLRPQKRANITKQGHSIARYFKPANNS